jgi:hypothetical protein
MTDHLLAQRALILTSRDVAIFGVGTSPIGKALTVESIEVGLVEAGTRRALAEALLTDAMIDIGDWVRAADTAGLPRARIARLAGVSRPTVYAALDT